MRVLSLFDGISCGHLALDKAGIEVETYYASEVDKFPIQVTQHHYPETIQLGDVKKVDGATLGRIDLLMGGSPCQDLSISKKDRQGLKGERSGLFYEYIRLLKEVKPKYFLLENVAGMKFEDKLEITLALGVEPILINSNLISAQNRSRLYWTNIPNVIQPSPKDITWKDIREHDVEDKYYYSDKALQWIENHSQRTGKKLKIFKDMDKCQMIEASHYKKYSSQRFFGIQDTKGLRYITPLECERAQTLPDNYCSILSDTQRYKCIGNGWTVDVIAHILNNIPKEDR